MKTSLTVDDIKRFGQLTSCVFVISDDLTLRIERSDDDSGEAPWEVSNIHGPVSEWTTRPKKAGERVLYYDRGSKRYYDFSTAVGIANRDGWGLSDKELAVLTAKLGRKPTKRQISAAAAESDFKLLRGWCNDEWRYIRLSVSLHDRSGAELDSDSLGGVESFGNSWRECAATMGTWLIERHLKEIDEVAYWAERDVMTGAPTLAN